VLPCLNEVKHQYWLFGICLRVRCVEIRCGARFPASITREPRSLLLLCETVEAPDNPCRFHIRRYKPFLRGSTPHPFLTSLPYIMAYRRRKGGIRRRKYKRSHRKAWRRSGSRFRRAPTRVVKFKYSYQDGVIVPALGVPVGGAILPQSQVLPTGDGPTPNQNFTRMAALYQECRITRVTHHFTASGTVMDPYSLAQDGMVTTTNPTPVRVPRIITCLDPRDQTPAVGGFATMLSRRNWKMHSMNRDFKIHYVPKWVDSVTGDVNSANFPGNAGNPPVQILSGKLRSGWFGLHPVSNAFSRERPDQIYTPNFAGVQYLVEPFGTAFTWGFTGNVPFQQVVYTTVHCEFRKFKNFLDYGAVDPSVKYQKWHVAKPNATELDDFAEDDTDSIFTDPEDAFEEQPDVPA